jgi:hypothetical protein
MVLQFQQQITDLLASDLSIAQLVQLEARRIFRFLPPTGLVPLRETNQGRGFDPSSFFRSLAAGEVVNIAGAEFRRLLIESLQYPPIDLSTSAAVHLRRVEDNLPGSGQAGSPYIVFTRMPAATPLVTVAAVHPPLVVHNGMEVRSDLLAQGLQITYGTPVDPRSATPASCFVTTELPFPSTASDRAAYGSEVVGFQPLVLAAEVEADTVGGIRWRPGDGTRALLRRGFPTTAARRPTVPFLQDWEVFDPGGSPSRWNYGVGGVVEQANPDAGIGSRSSFGFGTIAISRQRLAHNTHSIEMSTSQPPYDHQGQKSVGLVFNWTSSSVYFVFLCRYNLVPLGSDHTFPHAEVLQVANSRVVNYGAVQLGMITPREVHLNVRQAGNRLILQARIVQIGGQTVVGQPIELVNTTSLLANSAIGVMTRYTGPVQFTRLQTVHPDSGVNTLIPAFGLQRFLTRLTVKRSLLQPRANAGVGAGVAQQPGTSAPEADFERWFWTVDAASGYGYGYGYGYPGGSTGIGTALI